MSVHNALDRVIASGADKHLSLVTKIVIGMRATSRQGRPLAAIRTGWSINCAKAFATAVADSTCPQSPVLASRGNVAGG